MESIDHHTAAFAERFASALPAAIFSGVMFLTCFGLYLFVDVSIRTSEMLLENNKNLVLKGGDRSIVFQCTFPIENLHVNLVAALINGWTFRKVD